VKQSIIPKSNFLVAAFLQVILLGSTNAAVSKSGQCGLASVYSTDSEKTTSGEDTQPKKVDRRASVTTVQDSDPRRQSRKRALGGCADH
jgi:hypothetical protein